jgi:hypothetical protein
MQSVYECGCGSRIFDRPANRNQHRNTLKHRRWIEQVGSDAALLSDPVTALVDTMGMAVTRPIGGHRPRPARHVVEPRADVPRFDVVSRETLECPVCCEALSEGDGRLGCPSCGKGVHKACMERWLLRSGTCVTCRSDVWQQYPR